MGFDTAVNEPSKICNIWQNLANASLRKNILYVENAFFTSTMRCSLRKFWYCLPDAWDHSTIRARSSRRARAKSSSAATSASGASSPLAHRFSCSDLAWFENCSRSPTGPAIFDRVLFRPWKSQDLFIKNNLLIKCNLWYTLSISSLSYTIEQLCFFKHIFLENLRFEQISTAGYSVCTKFSESMREEGCFEKKHICFGERN